MTRLRQGSAVLVLSAFISLKPAYGSELFSFHVISEAELSRVFFSEDVPIKYFSPAIEVLCPISQLMEGLGRDGLIAWNVGERPIPIGITAAENNGNFRFSCRIIDSAAGIFAGRDMVQNLDQNLGKRNICWGLSIISEINIDQNVTRNCIWPWWSWRDTSLRISYKNIGPLDSGNMLSGIFCGVSSDIGCFQCPKNQKTFNTTYNDQPSSEKDQQEISPPTRIIWWRRGVAAFVLLCGSIYAIRNGLRDLLRGQKIYGWSWLGGALLLAEGACFT